MQNYDHWVTIVGSPCTIGLQMSGKVLFIKYQWYGKKRPSLVTGDFYLSHYHEKKVKSEEDNVPEADVSCSSALVI